MTEWVVSVHRRVDEVPDWDDIAGGGLFACAAWLRAFAPDVPLFLVCVRDRSGAPVAAACACLAERPGVLAHGAEPGFAFKHPTAAVTRPPDGDLYPFLLVGPPRGYAGRLLLRGDLDPAARREALAALLDGVRGAAAGAGARLISFAFLSLDELAEVTALEPRLVPSFGFTDFRLPVDSFAGYLAARGSYRARNAVEREMRNFAGEGFATEVRRLGDVMELAVPLIVGVTRKHGWNQSAAELERELEAIRRELDEATRVVCASRAGELAAVCVMVRHRGAYFARYAGLAADLPRRAAVYFNVIFYEPIRAAEREGVRDIHYGPAALEAKASRGCAMQPLWSGFLPASPWTQELRDSLDACSRGRLLERDAGALGKIVPAERLEQELRLAEARALLSPAIDPGGVRGDPRSPV